MVSKDIELTGKDWQLAHSHRAIRFLRISAVRSETGEQATWYGLEHFEHLTAVAISQQFQIGPHR